MKATNYCGVVGDIIWGVGTTKSEAKADAAKSYKDYYSRSVDKLSIKLYRIEDKSYKRIIDRNYTSNPFTILEDGILVFNDILAEYNQAKVVKKSFDEITRIEYTQDVYNLGAKLDILFDGLQMILSNQRKNSL